MNTCTGDDLLQKFEQLGIETGNLNPQVIKAWFDTDCQKTRKLLNWLCNAITDENVASAQEITEYQQLENVLEDHHLDKAVDKLSDTYPGIFAYEKNVVECEILEEKIELLQEEKERQEGELKVACKVKAELHVQRSETINADVKASCDLETATSNCQRLSSNLDEANCRLNEAIVKYKQYFDSLQFVINPQFVNAIEFEAQFRDIISHVSLIMNAEKSLDLGHLSYFKSELESIKHNIAHSHLLLLLDKLKVNKLKAEISFLDNYRNNGPLNCHSFEIIECKKHQAAFIMDTVKSLIEKNVELQISMPMHRTAQNELESYKSRLNYLMMINKNFIETLCHYCVIKILCSQEQAVLRDLLIYLKSIYVYVGGLGDCTFRINDMSRVIGEYENYIQQPIESKFNLIGLLAKFLPPNVKNSLTLLLNQVNKMKQDDHRLEKELFDLDALECFENSLSLETNVATLTSFLISGPTNAVVVVPMAVQSLCKEVNASVNQQDRVLQQALRMSGPNEAAEGKSRKDNKGGDRQKFWTHLLDDPQKLNVTIKKIVDNF